MILANIKYYSYSDGVTKLYKNVEFSRVPSVDEYMHLYNLDLHADIALQIIKVCHVVSASGYKNKGCPTCVLSCALVRDEFNDLD